MTNKERDELRYERASLSNGLLLSDHSPEAEAKRKRIRELSALIDEKPHKENSWLHRRPSVVRLK